MLNGIGIGLKTGIILISFLTIPVNIIQTYQYKEYILHWVNMDKEKYWKIFLRTDKKFKGIVWKKEYDFNQYYPTKEVLLGNICTSKKTWITIYKVNSHEIPDFKKVSIIQVLINNEFNTGNDSKIIMNIHGSGNNHNFYWMDPYLINFSEKRFNVWQTGLFNYDFTPMTDSVEKIIGLEVWSGKQNNSLKNIRVNFFCHK
jgi:hypothetical protein